MIIRKLLIWVFFIQMALIVRGERWSRQTLNSEWIPLAYIGNNQNSQNPVSIPAASVAETSDETEDQKLVLPPSLQSQYQNQLLQLQKTQESIRKLLLLQQQLKAQQQILQSQAYEPNAFANINDEKQALHQSSIINLQTLPVLAPEVLVPPVLISTALPPMFQSQDFLASTADVKEYEKNNDERTIINSSKNSEQDYLPTQDKLIFRGNNPDNVKNDDQARPINRFEGIQRYKEKPSRINFMNLPKNSAKNSSDNEQEIQLVYVPAETLAQRGQLNLHRPHLSKHLPSKHIQNHVDKSSIPLPIQEAYNSEIFHHLQKPHEEKNRLINSERQREISELNLQQKEYKQYAELYPQTIRKEQDIENKRKELHEIKEIPRHQELNRLQKIRTTERQQKENLADLKQVVEEEKDFEKIPSVNKKKEYSQDRTYKQNNNKKDEINRDAINGRLLPNVQSISSEVELPQAQPSIQDSQFYQQHLTEVTNKNTKSSRPRVKAKNQFRQYHREFQQPNEMQLTTPSPNQPPLSIYMGKNIPSHYNIRLSDVLKTFKNMKTIDVLDSFESNIPNIFVGPKNLDPPPGYAKFDLPYLSSLENNGLEGKFEKVPFFVAPLSFNPPSGYSKILFPAPHIGSVIIKNLENIEAKSSDNQNSITSLEPNLYNPRPSLYEISTSVSPIYDISTSKYEITSLAPIRSSTQNTFTEFLKNKPSTEFSSIATQASYQKEQIANSRFEQPTKYTKYFSTNEESTTRSYFNPKIVTTLSSEQIHPQSKPIFQAESIRNRDFDSLPNNQNTAHESLVQSYYDLDQQQQNEKYLVNPTESSTSNSYYLDPSSNYEKKTRYNLPAELPAISPQLPGLVNALVEKAEVSSIFQPSTTTIPSTTVTTVEIPSTYRSDSRHRNGISTTRATTNAFSSIKRNPNKKRPLVRSRSKSTTERVDSSSIFYDLTKATPSTTSKYDDQERYIKKSTIGNQKYRFTEHKSTDFPDPQIVNSNASYNYGNIYKNNDSVLIDSSDVNFEANIKPNVNLNISQSKPVGYFSSTAVPVDNFSNLDFKFTNLPLTDVQYVYKSTQMPNYQTSSAYDQAENDEALRNRFKKLDEISFTSPNTRNSPNYNYEKIETLRFEPITDTNLPNAKKFQIQDNLPVYQSTSEIDQDVENKTTKSTYYPSGNQNDNEASSPSFTYYQEKQTEYPYKSTVTETLTKIPSTKSTTAALTTDAPVINRQRVRGRLRENKRPLVESSIQTESRGSQNEYVRFSTLNQDPTRTNSKQRITSRTRKQPNKQRHSSIQTDNQEYVRIKTGQIEQKTPYKNATTVKPIKSTTEEYRRKDEYIDSSEYLPVQHTKNKATERQKGLRKRRIRVRVKPVITEDFVTAESQNYNSSFNNLSREVNKFRNFYTITEPTTVQQSTSTIGAIRQTSEIETPTLNYVFNKNIDKKDVVSTIIPNFVTSIPTLQSDSSWTNPPTDVTESAINEGETIMLQDEGKRSTNSISSTKYSTDISSREIYRDVTEPPMTTIMIINNTEMQSSISHNGVTLSTTAQTPEPPKYNSSNNIIQLLNSENSFKYSVTNNPDFREYLQKQEELNNSTNFEDNMEYPKNHRSKWTEVQYYKDKSFTKWNDKNQANEEKNIDNKQRDDRKLNTTVTDYVKAVFESIKSASEEDYENVKLGKKNVSISNQDIDLYTTEKGLLLPIEVKTSISTSSAVTNKPEVNNNSEEYSHSISTKPEESATIGSSVPSVMSEKEINDSKKSPFRTNLGKILRTTTKKVSEMTEICYRGHCIMSDSKKGLSR